MSVGDPSHQATAVHARALTTFRLSIGRLRPTPEAFILYALMIVLLLPVYVSFYSFVFLNPQASRVPVFTNLAQYYGSTESHAVVWGIIAPLLLAISAGAGIKDGMSWRTAILFVAFFGGYAAADYSGWALEKTENLADVLKNRDGIDANNLLLYFKSINEMTISAVAIVLGLAVSKLRGGG